MFIKFFIKNVYLNVKNPTEIRFDVFEKVKVERRTSRLFEKSKVNSSYCWKLELTSKKETIRINKQKR